jgi:hypothetical protein
MINDNIRAKIRKLLVMTERGGTENEKKIAMEKVHELMKEHSITEDEAGLFTEKIPAPKRKERWLVTLFDICGQFSGVVSLIYLNRFEYIGDEIGVNVAQELFYYLKNELKRKLKASKLRTLKAKRDYRMGFVMGVWENLERTGGWRDMSARSRQLTKKHFSDVREHHARVTTVNPHFYNTGKTVGNETNINRQAGVNANAGYLENVG